MIFKIKWRRYPFINRIFKKMPDGGISIRRKTAGVSKYAVKNRLFSVDYIYLGHSRNVSNSSLCTEDNNNATITKSMYMLHSDLQDYIYRFSF